MIEFSTEDENNIDIALHSQKSSNDKPIVAASQLSCISNDFLSAELVKFVEQMTDECGFEDDDL